jgi:amino-acid N-acetyltransferase
MIRKAKVQDIKQMQALINSFAKQGVMIARSLNELYEFLRDFWVIVENKKVIGCAGLHICWDDLAEIKSLAVARNKQGKGFGKELVSTCLNEAKAIGARKVFVLTYKPAYFKQFGFKRIKNSSLPHKIWAECINCSKFPNCQETALLKTL